eukprot:c9312_g1_i1 orf=120-617(+)
MAGTIAELGTLVLAKGSEEEVCWYQHRHKRSLYTSCDLLWKDYFRDPSQWWDNRTSKAAPSDPDFKHRVTKESLWIHGLHNPSWVRQELRNRGLVVSPQAQDGELSLRTGNVTRRNALLRNNERTAFVTLLRTCAKNRDLDRGTRVHDDILKRGLLEKCSDALVT